MVAARIVVGAFEQYANSGCAAALSFVFLCLILVGFAVGAAFPRVRRERRGW